MHAVTKHLCWLLAATPTGQQHGGSFQRLLHSSKALGMIILSKKNDFNYRKGHPNTTELPYIQLCLITDLRISHFKNVCNEPEFLGHLSLNTPVLTSVSKILHEDGPHEYL